jgi:DNA polymerase-3 subunit delta
VDEGDSLASFAGGVLRDLGHKVDRPALQWIAATLGGDRAVLRRELEKLSVYAGAAERITTADAEACLGDSAAVSLDAAALAAVAGDLGTLDRALGRCFLDGQSAVAVLRALNRTLTRIQFAAGMVEAGKTADAALKALRPKVYWKEKETYLQAVSRWSSANLARAIEILGEAELDCKRTGVPDQAVSWIAALRIAGAVRSKL